MMISSSVLLKGQNSDFLKMLEYGMKAPSGHNTQPWKFKINKNNIEVYPNFEQELPIVDKPHRELFISLGCAVTNICITANQLGYAYQREIIQKNKEIFIRINLNKELANKNPLFQQIDKRQTNRSVYKNKLLSQDTIDKLRKLRINPPVSIYFYQKGTEDFNKLSDFVYEGNRILFNNKDFKSELLDWIRFNQKDIENNKDGLAYNVLGSPSLPKWIGRPVVRSFLKPKSQNKTEREKILSSSHLVLIASSENNPENWILAGEALELFFLKCTELGVAVAFCNQVCEVETLSQKLRKEMNINNNYPMLLMRVGYSDKMPYSVRRPLEDVMIQ